MGLGGELMWAGVARELNERSGRKVAPCMQQGAQLFPVSSVIFDNNPRIQFDNNAIPMVMNDPKTNYCKSDTPERAVHRYDRHVIEQICEAYGIQDPKLKCELFLTQQEKSLADSLTQGIGDFIAIEPNVKNEYGVNKEYPFEKWQEVVDAVRYSSKRIIQLGVKGSRLLDGVIDMTGGLTFRETIAVMSRAKLLVASEGGLMHAANAVEIPAVIVITGFIHPRMTCYPENDNIWVGSSHGPCGMKVRCEKCRNECANHSSAEISAAVMRRLLCQG